MSVTLVKRALSLKWDIDKKLQPFVPQQPTLVEIDGTPQQPIVVDLDNRG